VSDGTGLPSGIVAFVFTDIEGSTRMFRRLGEDYVGLLERHDALLRAAWAEHGGVEVKHEGDGFFVAFDAVPDAVQACVDAQRALAAEPWPTGAEVRVRMGVHAGLAYPKGRDYVALAVHQAARVEAAGHGGQILVSAQAAELMDARDGVTLEPLGAFRVRDFDDPVRLHQARAAGIPDAFPAVRAVPAEHHNLTRPSTAFVGRADELAALSLLVEPGQLLTLVGPGGVGKTRLAIELGLAVAPDRADGVWLVDLSATDDPSLIPAVAAASLGVAIAGDADPWTAVVDHLRRSKALVILDTAEHLVDGLLPALRGLLDACRDLTVLVTSRVPLGAPGEQLFRVDPLPTAGVGAPAVELFAARAAAVDPAFRLDAATIPTVVAICERVDGLPFAIELAAARVGVLSLDEILGGLEDRFRLLRSRDRSIPERQRTLDALIGWSVRLLEPDAARVLRRLGVFTGGFGLEEAAAVTDVEADPDDVPELIWTLVESSLVAADRTTGATRYVLLGSVAAFARRELDAHDLLPETAERLGRWYVARFFADGGFSRDRLPELRLSLDNVRALVDLLEGQAPETAQWLACAIGEHHRALTQFRVGLDELRELARRLPAPTQARLHLLVLLSDTLLWLGIADEGERVLEEAEALRDEVGTPDESFDWSLAYDRADLVRRRGDPAAAAAIVQDALRGDVSDTGRSRMQNLLGVIRYEQGDFAAALDAFRMGLEADEHREHGQNIAIAHGNLAEVALLLGRDDLAATHALACLRRSGELGMSVTVGMAMTTAAVLAARDGDHETAACLAAGTETIYEATGFAPAAEEQGPTIASVLHEARERLGDVAFERERARGCDLSLPEAIALADEALRRSLESRAPSEP
jgi:predicted ATPase/class 3 adenylate cyclase